jgi:hypothetical protein
MDDYNSVRVITGQIYSSTFEHAFTSLESNTANAIVRHMHGPRCDGDFIAVALEKYIKLLSPHP